VLGPWYVSAHPKVAAYVALSRLPGFPHPLERRLAVLAAQLAAELGECRWCIERCRHDWREAGLSRELYQGLAEYAVSRVFTERERLALQFVEAVARSQQDAARCEDAAFSRARQLLTDGELAELTAIAAKHHCLESHDP
jgi:alkylhydroperoxidase family enzyme